MLNETRNNNLNLLDNVLDILINMNNSKTST